MRWLMTATRGVYRPGAMWHFSVGHLSEDVARWNEWLAGTELAGCCWWLRL